MFDFLVGFLQLICIIPVLLISIICFIFYVLLVFVVSLPLFVFNLIQLGLITIRNKLS